MRTPLLLITVILTVGVYTASVLLTNNTTLDFTDRSSSFTDAPFKEDERPAISLLTNLGVIQGNPDGSFRPERRLNRAEFVKVALLSHPSASAFVWGPITCFPDTLHQDWFSPYVCAAKERGIVQGYGDGTFRPAQPVTYGEAVKILTVLYGYAVERAHTAAEPWYVRYIDSAETRNVLLTDTLPYDTPITRGQMARLAAAFRAEEEGELVLYRELEYPKHHIPNPKKISSSKSQSFQPESQSSSLIVQSSSIPLIPFTPSQSHLLLLDRISPPIADGVFKSPGEDSDIAIVQVTLDREVKSIHELIIVDEAGTELSWPLRLYGFDEYNRTFRWEFEEGTEYMLPANTDRRFVVKAKFWALGDRGISEEMIEVREFWMMLRGRNSGQSLQVFAKDTHFPLHQTVQARIETVANAGAEHGSLSDGRGQTVASFRLVTADPYHTGVSLRHVTFMVDQMGVRISRPELGIKGQPERTSCFIDGLEDDMIFCPNLSDDIGLIAEGEVTISLFADIDLLPLPDRHLQVRLHDPGAIGRMGAIQWSDWVGSFTWVEGEAPVAVGTYWR